MYESMNGLGATLGLMKEDAMEVAKLGGGFLLGAGIAQGVLMASDKFLPASTPAWVQKWVMPAVPLALGTFLFAKYRGSHPALGGANGIGMVSVGLGVYLKRALESVDATKDYAKYIPLGATVDTYESNILAGLRGLGNMDYSINRYLSPSLNGYSRSAGAPTFVESLQGAPTQIQSLQGAPTSIESLNGLSATLM